MKALIPAAGLGTRWYPWSRIIPKELLPVDRYPAIHHVLDEVLASEITDIGIIINKEKDLIKSYVEEIWSQTHTTIRITWFNQSSPRGVGDALLCAKKWVGDTPTAVLYPDEIHPKNGGMVQIRKAFEEYPTYWVGILSEKQKRRQVCLSVREIDDNCYRVYGIAKINYKGYVGYSTGRYILANGFEHILDKKLRWDRNDGTELDDEEIMKPLWNKDIRGVFLLSPVFDVGDPDNWSLAVSGVSEKEQVEKG